YFLRQRGGSSCWGRGGWSGGSVHGRGWEADPVASGEAGVAGDDEEGRSAASRTDPWQKRDRVVRKKRWEKRGAVRRPRHARWSRVMADGRGRRKDPAWQREVLVVGGGPPWPRRPLPFSPWPRQLRQRSDPPSPPHSSRWIT
uniref:Uncharacterized protein n=4 Tax=Aegilops tauschii subsp. strangulata TaxID=200361 RepID=A0A453EGP6_AEGTS